MNVKKYIGMDVHQETISIAVMTGDGKLVMESIVETKASTILQFVQGLHGDLHVTLEEVVCFGTQSPSRLYAPSHDPRKP